MKIKIITALTIVFLAGCTRLDQTFYDRVTPETFFKSEKDIKAALYRPFTHARWYLGADRWKLQEYTADHFAITTKGRHWYNGGENERYHYHSWTPDDNWIWETWRGTLMGVALALDAKSDLSKLDYSKFALTQADKDDHVNQLNTLIALFYLYGLDYFGGLPIFESLEGSSLPRNTDQETFNHIETLLKEAILKLPKKQAADKEEGALRAAAAAALLARLYFNAEAYVGTPKFTEAQKLCEDIIAGVYGTYLLDPVWNGVHGFKNHESKEIIWSIPSEFNKLQYDWFYADFYHYNTRQYFDVDGGANNGGHLQPSRKPTGELYKASFRLGSPYEKFNDADLRKHPYKYNGGGRYEGMFIIGPHLTPGGAVINGGEEYKDKPLVFVDQVGRFTEVGPGKKYATVAVLPSRMADGEENTGVRLVKVPIPNKSDNSLRWGADNPAIRLSEIYFMLAECKMRAADPGGAATLINEVRKRNFTGTDPDPATVANLDEYRMLDEWGIEFLGEGRRRTDLIRFKKFTTETWWDHQPTEAYRSRFPVPTRAISGNNNLKQNTGYGK
ncbi:RagB/SusD family nutrient uptake outer membrane protein [Chitinophaga barathri]|uniref:RagB/SusD family nutrient uptake outer membrane protein n=1 Tax=Chitinophaga barathri TaxID=1647451 RepID=A0A3N4MDP8_9BACT|nr:RagB/SusD family nutrient uptake outer membrane protein [Chitinophaga barathri]RPD42082.1 RagB/SusD family nutrient uptake outer membrane protein [Chitinophaga barathri]